MINYIIDTVNTEPVFSMFIAAILTALVAAVLSRRI